MLFASVTLLAGVIASWFGLKAYTAVLRAEIRRLDGERQELSRSRSPKAEAKLLSQAARARHVAEILKQHRSGSAAFVFLQDLVQPGVAFENFQANYDTGQLTFQMRAASFGQIAQQIVAFERDPRVAGVSIGDVSRDVGSGSAATAMTVSLTEEALLAQ